MSMREQWSEEQAMDWASEQPWVVGCNFIPSTAVNQLEFWQAETFDPETIDRELGWAAGYGMNAVRVYLHDIAYEIDPKGLLERIDRFLTIASKHGIRTMFVFFDDCWNAESKPGPQPLPRPGVHNSGWLRSPQDSQRRWPADLDRLKVYVQAVIDRHKDDPRIYVWDLYNEPGNSHYEDSSLVLMSSVFEWAWEIRPSQPLTVGTWFHNDRLNNEQLECSDVITFHDYGFVEGLRDQIGRLRQYGRPVICTEWLARTTGSLVQTHLPVFKAEQIACFNWGLVAGKTQTIYPWGSALASEELDPWFHDLFFPDGKPYCAEEAAAFRELTSQP
ncbi:MAG: cellulase family glycosylhydrolase [Fimbriimonas sp.]